MSEYLMREQLQQEYDKLEKEYQVGAGLRAYFEKREGKPTPATLKLNAVRKALEESTEEAEQDVSATTSAEASTRAARVRRESLQREYDKLEKEYRVGAKLRSYFEQREGKLTPATEKLNAVREALESDNELPRNVGSTAVEAAQQVPEVTEPIKPVVAHESTHEVAAEGHDSLNLPATFNEIRHMPGHSIEDFVANLPDITDLNITKGGLTRLSSTVSEATSRIFELPNEDREFIDDADNIKRYKADLALFTQKVRQENSYPNQRSAVIDQIGWVQHDSKAFVRGRVEEKTTDIATSRFYLNPQLSSTLDIYREIFDTAESAGLKFRGKVLNFDFVGETSRRDPIVFYAFDESKEQLYQIIKEAYERHQSEFDSRQLGFAPFEVASGFGVGEEPIELSGQESLSSYVESNLEKVYRNKEWERGNTPEERKRLFAAAFRRQVRNKPINPDNIAFR